MRSSLRFVLEAISIEGVVDVILRVKHCRRRCNYGVVLGIPRLILCPGCLSTLLQEGSMLGVRDCMRFRDMQVGETSLTHYLAVTELLLLDLFIFLLFQDSRSHC